MDEPITDTEVQKALGKDYPLHSQMREDLRHDGSSEKQPMKGLTVGRMVHYAATETVHRAAVITDIHDKTVGSVDLLVLDTSLIIDPTTHTVQPVYPVQPHHWVEYSEDKESGTWHWIEEA